MKNVKVGSTYYFFQFNYNASTIGNKITNGDLILAKAKVKRITPGDPPYSRVSLTDIINRGYQKNKESFLVSERNLYLDLGAILKKIPSKVRGFMIGFIFEVSPK